MTLPENNGFHTGALNKIREAAPSSVTRAVAGYLKGCEVELRKMHTNGASGSDVCSAYSLCIDDLLKTLFEMKATRIEKTMPLALVAVGGYGRSELNLRSDIDLLLLHEGRTTPELEELTQSLLYVLWDTGLDLGFSIRTVKESIGLAGDDTKTMTALLDLRHILGRKALSGALVSSIRKRLLNRRCLNAFINEKLTEKRSRHNKYGGSVYLLEPNVKESEGGLRDFHAASWILKAGGETGAGPVSRGLLSERDMKRLKGSLDFLLWVRNELHFETSRKTDQLTFDHQERIAGLLGFSRRGHTLAVEAFMQTYYMHAYNVNHYSDLITSRFLHRNRKRPLLPARKKIIDPDYSISEGALRFSGKDAVIKDPVTAFRAFEYAQSRGVDIDQHTQDLLLRYLEDDGEEIRSCPGAAESFLRILNGPNLYKTLSEMHRLKFIDSLIPEFGKIRCRVQHDLYHVYTVDAHTLFAVRELERLEGEGYAKDFPLFSTIYREIPNRGILILAVLLHDIGKALGKGHSEKGARLVPGICKRLGLNEEDSELLEFLVINHLILADTAQYRDIHDEKLVLDFALRGGEAERLKLLYLLTFADVRAVGPDVWSQWKGALFQELYSRALRIVERGVFEIEAAGPRVGKIKERMKEMLLPEGITEATVEKFFTLLPQRYFLSTGLEFIANHIRIYKTFDGTTPLVMRVRQDTVRGYTEFIICTYDIQGLFFRIAGVMAANGLDILGAEINTLRNGFALDILQVKSPHGGLITDKFKIEKIEKDMADVITGRRKVEDLIGRRKPSILDRKEKPRVPTRVYMDNGVSDSYTVIDILTQNRIGLLYDITRRLTEMDLYIYIAKVSTKGDEAADIFYIKDIFGQKVYFKERLAEIEKTLIEDLTPKGAGKFEK